MREDILVVVLVLVTLLIVIFAGIAEVTIRNNKEQQHRIDCLAAMDINSKIKTEVSESVVKYMCDIDKNN